MKVECDNDSIIIIPETSFEEEWLQNFNIDRVFHKTGVTASSYVGLKITKVVNQTSEF
jgi:hypothetical protein